MHDVIEGYHKDIGSINFIDTRGTNDTNEFDDSAIFKGLLSYFMKQSKLDPKVDALLYFHDSNQKSRYYGNVRLPLVSTLLSDFDSSKNCILISTKYNDLTSKNRELFETFLLKYRNQFSSIVYWDSVEPLEEQYLKLSQALKNVQPSFFGNLVKIEQNIIKEAEHMRETRKIKKYRKYNIDKTTTEVIDVKKKDLISKSDKIMYKMLENSSGWCITLKLWKHCTTTTQEESVLICPNYPSRVEDKTLGKITLKQINSNKVTKFNYSISGENEPTGKVIMSMTHDDAQFGNSWIEVEINFSYSYNETYLDKEVVAQKYLRKKSKNMTTMNILIFNHT